MVGVVVSQQEPQWSDERISELSRRIVLNDVDMDELVGVVINSQDESLIETIYISLESHKRSELWWEVAYERSRKEIKSFGFSMFTSILWVAGKGGNQLFTYGQAYGFEDGTLPFEVLSWMTKKNLMRADDYKHYRKLPKKIVVFRSEENDEDLPLGYGPSWTTDYAVAKWFYDHHFSKSGRIVKSEITRSDICFFTNERNEGEIVTKMVEAPLEAPLVYISAASEKAVTVESK